jgi:hypothetical protein
MKRPARDAQLGALPLQVGDGLLHLFDGAGPHPAALVQHPVDGRLAEPGLRGDLADAERSGHGRIPVIGGLRSWARS